MTAEQEVPYLALVVDDEPDIVELLQLTLERMGVNSMAAGTLAAAFELLGRHTFDLCLTDMRLPDGNGIDLVRRIQQLAPDTPVAVITAHGSMDAAIEALKAGAFDFVNKPLELRNLRELIQTALRLSERTYCRDRRTRHRLLGESAVMRGIRSTIAKLARSQAPVYISGESGTGKELVARLIHEKGPRAEQPFIPVNCGAIPHELMESEFFGHKKGSFTGAVGDKQGLFQAAQGGTLFLDEVADLPMHMQVKLLRAIQEKAIRPIGAAREEHTDVRILCATHKDLQRLVHAGEFREDLYYRLNVIELRVPPLRERPGDIPMLTEHFLERLSGEMRTGPARLSDAARDALMQHAFPGNIRELENILERALTLCDGQVIDVDDLQLSRSSGASAAPVPPPPEYDVVELEPYLMEVEKEVIGRALEQADYNKTAAAKALGISFRALRYRLKKLGLE